MLKSKAEQRFHFGKLGRRLATANQPVINNSANGSPTVTISEYDPQVEFLEIGTTVNNVRAWKVYGPDMNGVYGGMQGTGGLEATVLDSGGTATGVLNDYFGNGIATITGTGGSATVTWNTAHVGAYGPLPGNVASPLTNAAQLASVVGWRGHVIDPTGFYWLGARYYEPTSSRFLSADPMGQAASMSLYDFCNGDPLNYFDPDGRKVQFEVKIIDGIPVSTNKQAVLQIVAHECQSPAFCQAWQQLVKSDKTYSIGADIVTTPDGEIDMHGDAGDFARPSSQNEYTPTITVDPLRGQQFEGNQIVYPSSIFAHEVQHAIDYDDGKLDYYSDQRLDWTQGPFYAPNEAEARAQAFANKVAGEIGDCFPKDYPELDDDSNPLGFTSKYIGPVIVNTPVPPKKTCNN